jgi:iron(III) transport system ATP-binding protein
MVSVKMKDLTKRFGDVTAVDHLTVQINEGELCTLLGPSGCGKTSTLRCIAGFYFPDEGEIFFGNKLVNSIPPFKRNTGMVFQNYALWPHMNVFDNIAYGLKVRKIEQNKLKDKITAILDLVHLEGLKSRWPSQLSGGQQQRVALARALVIEPDVLLLDEPLSNLDAKLRVDMRTEIKKIQKKMKISTIYVTHDQEEALCISDKVVVMNKGKAQQIGTPRQIYEKPVNSFVADFIGIANFIKGKIVEVNKNKLVVIVETEHGFNVEALFEEGISQNMDVLISVRPEAIVVYGQGSVPEEMNSIDGVVRLTNYYGDVMEYEIETSWGTILRADIHNPRHANIFHEKNSVSVGFKKEDVKLIEL